MSARANYFKIGVFVLLGTALLAVGLIAFGVGALVSSGVLLETYVDESVQGLEVGSPVKYRGVRIGSVESIELAAVHYAEQLAYEQRLDNMQLVMVVMRMDPRLADERLFELNEGAFLQMVGRGMRVRVAQQGITGAAYMAVDMLENDRNPILKPLWQPDNLYLPSAPSIIKEVSDSVDAVFRKLQSIDIESIGKNLDLTLERTAAAIESAEVAGISEDTRKLLKEILATTRDMRELVTSPELQSVPGDIGAAAAAARQTMGNIDARVDEVLKNLEQASMQIREAFMLFQSLMESEEVGSILSSLATGLQNLESASGDAPAITARMQASLTRLDQILANREQDLNTIIRNLRQVSENLNYITTKGRDYPSQLLFGEPPRPPEVTR